MKDVILNVTPILVDAFAALAMVLLSMLAQRGGRILGVQLEAKHREALHEALRSGVQAALARGLGQSAAVDVAISHAQASVPDALKALSPTLDVLRSLALSKVGATKGAKSAS